MKRLLLAGIFTLLLSTTFGQSTLTIQNTGTETPLYGCDFFDANTGIAVGDMGLILKTNNGGATWETITTSISTMLNAVNYVDANTIIIVGDDALVMRSTDGGITWTDQIIQNITNADLLCIDIDESGTGVIGGQYNTILTTNDAGITWNVVQEGMMGTFYSVRLYDGVNAVLFGVNAITETFITRLEAMSDITFTHRYRIFNNSYFAESKCFDAYVFSADSFLMAGCQISSSYAGWQAYVTKSRDLEEVEWYSDFLRDSSYFLGMDLYDNHVVAVGGRLLADSRGKTVPESFIQESFDRGTTWITVPPVTGCDLYDVKVLDGVTYMVGDSGRILKATPPVSVRDNQPQHRLNIYPNPAKDRFTCSFSVIKQDDIQIAIVSPEGKIIKTLFSGKIDSGDHNLTFYINDVAQGIYYLRLKTSQGVETKKICIIN